MKRSYICVIIASGLFFSCQKSTNSQTAFREKLQDKELTDSLYDRALHHGDTVAYLKLRMIYYIGGSRKEDFLYYSLIMSNKYKYKEAAHDVYFILSDGDNILDDQTREMANDYLMKSK
jgi:hypothetical protein